MKLSMLNLPLQDVVNFFFHTTAGHLTITAIALVLFGLLAWKTSGKIEKNQKDQHLKKAEEGKKIREQLGIEEHDHQ